MKRGIGVKLQAWMRENRWTDKGFAEKFTAHTGDHCSRRTVENWRKGIAVPRPKAANAIKEITGGAVTSDDHMAAYLKKQAS